MELASRSPFEFPSEPGPCFANAIHYNPAFDFPPPEPPPVLEGLAPWLLTGPGGRILELPGTLNEPERALTRSVEREPGFLAPGEWTLHVPEGWNAGPFELALRIPAAPDFVSPAVVRLGEDFELSWPAEQVDPANLVRAEVFLWEPDPEVMDGYRGAHVRCEGVEGLSSMRIPLSDLPAAVDGATEVEVRFTVEATTRSPMEGVDRFEGSGTVYRSWAIPVE